MPEDDEYRDKIDNITVVVERIENCLMGNIENPGGLIREVRDNTVSTKENKVKLEKRTAKDLALLSSVVLLLIGIVFSLLK